ncbi:MBOAT family O-acyltransferase [Herbaspirillum lusitanum]|uniref:MBOAT family O-acyltransferase n=1 Tax=Herbaspirillum lusitanum TaxID=213312 RepID=UPI0002D2BAAC|nr:MBOAT family O-acyltransferase [Herbaspirillum lusitanum]
MLFNSLDFIFVFLPLSLLVAAALRRNALLFWLTVCSAVFYAFAGHIWFLIPMAITTGLDFWVGRKIYTSTTQAHRKLYLCISLVCNLGLLAYFKYSGLFLHTAESIEALFGSTLLHTNLRLALTVVLPAGISFYTFQTISYVIDIYRKDADSEPNFLKYLSFVTFFPHLIAGPLTRHNQLIPQLSLIANNGIKPRWEEGIYLFAIGLAKKVLIADRIANLIDPLISDIGNAGMIGAWLALIGFALQIYFDFSGYSDMAIGLGRLFGIELPRNFNSPYKALNPADFWKRWHITLSQWLRDYLYISLGGNRCSPARRRLNLMITMVLGGLWHGANWTFALWGLIHGLMLVLYHSKEGTWNRCTPFTQRCLTLLLVVIAWVPFRSDSLTHTFSWYLSMVGSDGLRGSALHGSTLLWLAPLEGIAIWIALRQHNSLEIGYKNLSRSKLIALSAIASASVLMMNYSSRFLYFQF